VTFSARQTGWQKTGMSSSKDNPTSASAAYRHKSRQYCGEQRLSPLHVATRLRRVVAEFGSMGSRAPSAAPDVAECSSFSPARRADPACCARPAGRARAGRPGGRWWSVRATAANPLAHSFVSSGTGGRQRIAFPAVGTRVMPTRVMAPMGIGSQGKVPGNTGHVLRRLRSSWTPTQGGTSRPRHAAM
jgi:hypothetical protein